MTPEKQALLKLWYETDLVQFGDFTLKSKQKSGVYFNFRKLWTNPSIFKETSRLVAEFIRDRELDTPNSVIVPLPYAGISLAATLSIELSKPHIIFRKEPKQHGTHNNPTYLENPLFLKDIIKDKKVDVIFVDDVLTTGSTLIESLPFVISELEDNGFEAGNMSLITLLTRSDRHLAELNKKMPEIRIHSFTKIDEVLQYLYLKKCFDDNKRKLLLGEFEDYQNRDEECKPANRLKTKKVKTEIKNTRQFIDRILTKKTNICLSWDYDYVEPLLEILPHCADKLIALKLHQDIYKDKNLFEVLVAVGKICQEKKVYIIEDRKLSDIGSTVKKQIENLWNGNYSMLDFVTVHPISGEGIFEAFKDLKAKNDSTPLPIVVESMSCSGNLCNESYVESSKKMCEKYISILGGVVTQLQNTSPDILTFTPGVHNGITGDSNDQRYQTPTFVSFGLESDVLIMGRDLFNPPMYHKNNTEERWSSVPDSSQTEEISNYTQDLNEHLKLTLSKIF